MTDPTTPSVKPLTDPEMEGTYFGIPVAYFGEEGNMLALGHHTPRRALAAFNRHARVQCGLHNLADDPQADIEDWIGGIRTEWILFSAPDEPDYLWFGRPVVEGTPGALPVTLLMA
ncbi:hypothetical protein [Streptomyces sp. NPDC126503]|uniref:hypothetical protein n=1 Tax=Streptomyces sp. NPDC126503 TaxID=3155315 RepID=UPI00331E5CB0